MNHTSPRPRHPSYLAHRRQVAWQIILPIAFAGLILVGLVYLVVWGTFSASGDVQRWAEISTMWLTLPVMIAALVLLAVLIGITYLVALLAGFIPRYSVPAQKYAAQMLAAARKVEWVGHKPLRIFPELARLIRTGFKRALRQ